MIYQLFLDDNLIGTSLLEKADAPMGCVSGAITFADASFNCSFFSRYCKDKNIITDEDLENNFISTQTISTLKVFNEKGVEIKGLGCYLEGFGDDPIEVNIIGIPYPFYGEEFPHHRKAYDDQVS